ncbi:MAG: Sortase-like acyltransferase [Frankiales bacterium]|jgi:ribosomal protein S18 acetylase RimI-like enzyme|nr:Sortase-like acyltransferase [Frankiales bacterium]
MDVLPLTPALAGPLEEFFRRVPESDHNSFAEDVLAPGVVQGWLTDTRALRSCAVDGGRVVGYVAVLPLVGWSSHVGSLRVVVDPEARGKGVGRDLARHGLLASLELGLTKTVVEVVVDAVPAIGMFEAIGFEPEALLRDHVRDRTGELHDLVVLAHLVEGTWSGMTAAGLADELV